MYPRAIALPSCVSHESVDERQFRSNAIPQRSLGPQADPASFGGISPEELGSARRAGRPMPASADTNLRLRQGESPST